MVPFRATLFSEMKYSFIGEDSFRGSLSEIWIHGCSRHFLQYLMGHQSSVSNTAHLLQICISCLFCSLNHSWVNQIGHENIHKTFSRDNSSVYFEEISKINPFSNFPFATFHSVFFLNRLTSLEVQSFVRNHQPVHTKSAWLHASKKIKGSEVGTVIQGERVVCLQAYRFIPSCIFTSKPLSMQISLVWTVDPPITAHFCFFFLLSF